MAAQRKTIAMQQQLPGRLQAVRTAEVRARVDGIVEAMFFTEGKDVVAQEKLYQIDARTLQAAVKSAMAAVERANAEHLLAKQTLERLKPLVHTEAVSRQEFDQATAQFKKTGAEITAAQAALTRANIDLEYATITAPIAGRAGRSKVTPGALVSQKEATHLVTIEQIDPIWVNFSQSSVEMLRLQRAMRQGSALPVAPVEISLLLEDDTEYEHMGQLHFTDRVVDPQTGSVAMRADFPNPGGILLPGQFVRVQLALARSEGVTVPQRAVQNGPQGQTVLMVDENSKVVVRPIKTGGFSGQDWIVLEGLREGEKVIVNGVQKARPGTVVTPKEVATPATAARAP